MPEEDGRNALLVRGAMERTLADLPPVHDLVPAAVAQGRRRRARTRVLAAAGVACAVAAVVFGSVTLPAGSGGRTTVRPAASGTPAPRESSETYRTPVHIEPTSDGEETMADLPSAERARREDFQQQAAALLDKLLPKAVGLIRPVDLEVRRYEGQAEDGRVFPVIFSVRPSDDGSGGRPPCTDAPGGLKGGSCERATLPGGIEAASYRLRVNSAETTSTTVYFSYGDSDVALAVYPDDDAAVSAPVTNKELLAVVGDSRFLDLVRYADENPMQERQASIAGG
ncbi:hypothetical protein ACFYXS_38400 [Streptomyces sp. NPDC002574]|uniref:hypothetical protein n=1 Tax=Streptomyces sp. NPDC002574 TaxID=3364652 RepID=UPI0036CCDF97